MRFARESLEMVLVKERDRWNEILARTEGFDCYHTPEYHEVAEVAGEGKAVLFVLSDFQRLAAWPFLLRSLDDIGGMEHSDGQLLDATSVYGYCGPVFSEHGRRDLEFIQRFGCLMRGFAKELHLVSLFSRMHPLLGNTVRKLGFGRFVPMGKTVSINLLRGNNEQWSAIRKSHRYEIRRAKALGVRAIHDEHLQLFDSFVILYNDTMKRVGAAPFYFFSPDHFLLLRSALRDRLHLFVAELEGRLLSACLFVHTGSIIQYFLSATSLEGRKIAANKLVLNEARLWGRSVGATVLHLGGGVSGANDNLLAFKEGFSRTRHRFYSWQTAADTELYEELVSRRLRWLYANHSILENRNYFPLYRAPGVPYVSSGNTPMNERKCRLREPSFEGTPF